MAHRFGGRRQSGPDLPYELLAGVVPTRAGWVVASAKLLGIQLHPNPPELLGSLAEVLDYRPSFRVIALGCPIGLLEEPEQSGRTCDREARKLLGWPRSGAVLTPPVRKALQVDDYEEAARLSGGLSAVTWGLMHRIAEVDGEMEPYRQRTVFEVHPELSLYQLNDDKPMRHPKRTVAGQEERKALVTARISGMETILDAEIDRVRPWQLIDAAACLTTTRRIAARAMTRIPQDPEWDEKGLRMELVL
jgi:predicted RNase H-like nuclease